MGEEAALILEKLLSGETVSRPMWERCFFKIFQGKAEPVTVKRILLLLARKGENAEEIWGCLGALRRLEPPRRVNLPYLIDLCGTGGDRLKTFNVSTVSSFVVAGAGASVAKHGNRAVSSKAGSSDLMEALGVRIDIPPRRMLEALRRFRFGYFHAPLYHPSFRHVQPLRRELGVRTLFNALGPLLNPIEVSYQMVGVSNARWLNPMGDVLRRLRRKRAVVVHGEDGLDELSIGARNDILYLKGSRLEKMRLDAEKFGFRRTEVNAYVGGDQRQNAEIAQALLRGRLRGPYEDIVLLNSGVALWVSGLGRTVSEGIERARWSLRSGRALEVLENVRAFTCRKLL